MGRDETHGTRVFFEITMHRSDSDGHMYRIIDVYTYFGHHIRTRVERVK